jgi:hypothetical protein
MGIAVGSSVWNLSKLLVRAVLLILDVLIGLLDLRTLQIVGRAVFAILSIQLGLPSALSINESDNSPDGDFRPIRMVSDFLIR